MSNTSMPAGCSDPECDLDPIPGRERCLCGAPVEGVESETPASTADQPLSSPSGGMPENVGSAPAAPPPASAGPAPGSKPPAPPDPFASAIDRSGDSPPVTSSPAVSPTSPSSPSAAGSAASGAARPNVAPATSNKKLRRPRSVVHVKPENDLSEVIEPDERPNLASQPTQHSKEDERYAAAESSDLRQYRPEGLVSPVGDGDRAPALREQPVDELPSRRPQQVGGPVQTSGATCRVCGRHKPRSGQYFCQCGAQVRFDNEVAEVASDDPPDSWWRRVTGTSPSFGRDRRTMSQRRRDAGANLRFASRLERQTRMVLAGGVMAWLGLLGLGLGPFRDQVRQVPELFIPFAGEEIDNVEGLPSELVDGSPTTVWQESWSFGEVLPQTSFNRRDCASEGDESPEEPVHEERSAGQDLVLEATLPETFDVVEVWLTIGPTLANTETGLAEPTRIVSQVRLTFLDPDRNVVGCSLHDLVSSPERQVLEVDAEGTRFVEIVPTAVRSSVRLEAPFVQLEEIKIIED